MDTIVVITTGGTIASTSDENGAKRASASPEELLAGITPPPGVTLRSVDLMRVNSATMDLSELDAVAAAVTDALKDPDVRGVVVTHGTDTMEETSFLVDLQHDDPRPVVFTGAQRSHDMVDPDGPGNLADAVAVAAAAEARDLGALICFGGEINQAAGTRKVHNSATTAFADPDHGPVGAVIAGDVRIRVRRPRSVTCPRARIADTRVDVIACYPGVDSTTIDAAVAAGAAGIVLEAPGTGNANVEITQAVDGHVRAGVVVVVASRVLAGAVRPVYGGGGGGVDMVAAGAHPAGDLRPSQARILLALLLAGGAGTATIREAFTAGVTDAPGAPLNAGLSAGSTPRTE